jgi:hypothetical protein
MDSDIRGYSWLSETRFGGRPVLLVSFNADTCVGDPSQLEECFTSSSIPCSTMAIVPGPGEKAAHSEQK